MAQEHGCDVACPGRATLGPLEEVGMLRLELVGVGRAVQTLTERYKKLGIAIN